jgi:hypothetical protein
MDAQTATASRRVPSRGQRVVLLALAGAATALALLGHRGVAALAPATRLDGLDNVFLAALLLGLAVLDGMGRLLPEGGAPGARRLRRALWLAFAAAVLAFGADALGWILAAELVFDALCAVRAMRSGGRDTDGGTS